MFKHFMLKSATAIRNPQSENTLLPFFILKRLQFPKIIRIFTNYGMML